MRNYVLQVNYFEGDDPLLIPLRGCSPGDAEAAHQALETEIEHAKTMGAPVVFSQSTDEHPDAGVPIDPARVTGINLIESNANDGDAPQPMGGDDDIISGQYGPTADFGGG